jgi:predicted outer membrane repeat protein
MCRVWNVNVTASNFTGNTALQQGGAVYAIESRGQTLMSGARFTNNTASGDLNHTLYVGSECCPMIGVSSSRWSVPVVRLINMGQPKPAP